MKWEVLKLKQLLEILEVPVKIVSSIVAILAIGAFISPKSIWSPIEALISQKFGISGWVYYEVGDHRSITEDGQLYLLKASSEGLYNEIQLGDKLRANSAVNFRQDKGLISNIVFLLNSNDCVIVISRPEDPVTPKQAKSGGWLQVSTTPCGLF